MAGADRMSDSALGVLYDGAKKRQMLPEDNATLSKYSAHDEPAFFDIFLEKRHMD